MPIKIDILAETAFEAAIGAAKGHGEDYRAYLEQRAAIFSQGAASIVRDRLSGAIDDSDVEFAWKEILAAEETARLAMKVTAKVALQDAINAASAVVRGAVNQALGVKIL